VFLDSPMAIEATRIYTHHIDLFDDEMRKYMREKLLRADLKTMKATESADESKAINFVKGPCLVMAGAGMCNAGRILHHLRQNVWKPETHVLIVGYQARGSIGRQLVEGEKFVRIHGERIAVRAQIHTMGGFSAHAGQTDLLNWFGVIAPSKPRVVMAHGEDGPREGLAKLIRQRYGLKPALPMLGDVIEL
jgi:metallo-beta-lactamase family protein